jgi:hypothetical protein
MFGPAGRAETITLCLFLARHEASNEIKWVFFNFEDPRLQAEVSF